MKNTPLSNRIAYYGTYATFLLSAAFIVLRLLGLISWSWWWVISPVLIPFGIALLLVMIGLILLRKYGKR